MEGHNLQAFCHPGPHSQRSKEYGVEHSRYIITCCNDITITGPQFKEARRKKKRPCQRLSPLRRRPEKPGGTILLNRTSWPPESSETSKQRLNPAGKAEAEAREKMETLMRTKIAPALSMLRLREVSYALAASSWPRTTVPQLMPGYHSSNRIRLPTTRGLMATIAAVQTRLTTGLTTTMMMRR